jgi:hypothetical protein
MNLHTENETGRIAEPEWIHRDDTEHGAWQVDDCEARRGIPATSIVDRQMLAPRADTPQARAIRAHELMHAKVSPAGEWEQWQNRKIASVKAMVVCEELRVNYLCGKAGFDVMTHLTDGTETADGERYACTNDWIGAVHMTIATAGTASSKPFLNGVRRHNRMWGKALLSISKRAIKEMDKANLTGKLASTETDRATGLAPKGFIFTEKMAEWVDRLAGMPPENVQEEEEGKSKKSDSSTGEEQDSDTIKVTHSNIGENKPKPLSEKEYLNKITSVTPDSMGRASTPYWGELNILKLPLTVVAQGNLGKKRTASNIGRSPRRLHRYMSDPQKRIFDNKKRGLGGVVVIDCSGSMTLTRHDVRKMLDASPGATVLAYSDIGEGRPNAWILADKGRMVSDLDFPEMGAGNGVDFPALEWGVKHRQHSSAPVIWVTDGGVCGPNQGFSTLLANQCTAYAKEKKVVIVEDATKAVETLEKLKAGAHIEQSLPYMLKDAWGDR